MKNLPVVNFSGSLERDAARILRDIPGVTVDMQPGADGRGDVVIQAGDVTYTVEIKAQQLTNASAARQLVDHASRSDTYVVLVARSITREACDILAEAGIGFIDLTGAMRFDLPALYVWREGTAGAPISGRGGGHRVRLAGKAGVATQAVLNDPGRSWKIHDLAAVAGVSVGLVHRLFLRLEDERLVRADGAGPQKSRRVVSPAALLDLWVEEMRDRGVQQLRAFRLARDPHAQLGALARQLDQAKIDYAVTGAAAAAELAPFVTSIPVTDVWVTELRALGDVAAAVNAEEVDEGHNVVFRHATNDTPLAFRSYHDSMWLADDLRIYLDLRADPRRGREQADRLREDVIGF